MFCPELDGMLDFEYATAAAWQELTLALLAWEQLASNTIPRNSHQQSSEAILMTQANVKKTDPPEKWPLDKLCERMVLFFPQMGPQKSGNNALTKELVLEECDYDYEEIRYYLRERAAEAYHIKVPSSATLYDIVHQDSRVLAERLAFLGIVAIASEQQVQFWFNVPSVSHFKQASCFACLGSGRISAVCLATFRIDSL